MPTTDPTFESLQPLPHLPPLFRTQGWSKVTSVSWWILLKIKLSGSHVWNNWYKHAGIHWISLQFNVHHHFPIGDVPILSNFSISRSLPGCSQLSISKHLLGVAQQPHRGVAWQPVPAAGGQSAVKLVVGRHQTWLDEKLVTYIIRCWLWWMLGMVCELLWMVCVDFR